jgi:hypothetical protein
MIDRGCKLGLLRTRGCQRRILLHTGYYGEHTQAGGNLQRRGLLPGSDCRAGRPGFQGLFKRGGRSRKLRGILPYCRFGQRAIPFAKQDERPLFRNGDRQNRRLRLDARRGVTRLWHGCSFHALEVGLGLERQG